MRSLVVGMVCTVIILGLTGCGDQDTDATGQASPPGDAQSTPTHAPGDQVIPLQDIWAVDMPGTRALNRTQVGDPPTYESPEGPLTDEILRALAQPPEEGASECFAVAGEGFDALREAHAVLVEGRAIQSSFDKDGPVTIVFFSYEFGSYIHLAGSEQRGESVQVFYTVVPHLTREVTAHIALIPVPALGSGTFRVEVKLDVDTDVAPTNQESEAQRIVCRSFDFDVAA